MAGSPLVAKLTALVALLVATEDAALFRREIERVEDRDWPAFERSLNDALRWRSRNPPLRQVKLARLAEESALRRPG